MAIRLGLVGGGPGSFIGPVHRLAAEMDRKFVLVAGAFSSDPERSGIGGQHYGIDPERAYPSLEAMIERERDRPDGIQMVAITTPNHLHLPQARLALEAGLAVMSDKPATATLAEAHALNEVLAETGGIYGLTFTYTGYPMIREARARIAAGELGVVRKVVAEYFQGWLADTVERDNKQAAWRVDPARAGLGGCVADIGVHAFNLVEFVLGDSVREISADLASVVPGRVLDDDATILLRFGQGTRGLVAASQIAIGERNNLRLRVYGDKAALEWSHEAADRLVVTDAGGEARTIWSGSGQMGSDARAATRLPAGHPEGYLEAFANLYGDFADLMNGKPAPLLPGIAEGLRSMAFVESAVRSNHAGWTELRT